RGGGAAVNETASVIVPSTNQSEDAPNTSAHLLVRSSAPPLLSTSAPPLLSSSAPPLLSSSAPQLLAPQLLSPSAPPLLSSSAPLPVSESPRRNLWLFSARTDLSVFLGSAVVSLVALWIGARAG